MAVKKGGTSPTGEGRSGSSRSRTREDGPVRVWSECGVTVAVTENPPQFIRFLTGAERIAPDSSETTRKRVEAALYAELELTVDKRVKKMVRLVKAANTTLTAGRSRRRS